MSESLQERLAAARAAKAEVEARRAAKAAAGAALAEVQQAEREAREAAALEELEAEHGPVGKGLEVVETPGGIVVVKPAHPAIFKRFQDEGNFKVVALEKLGDPSVVYPSRAEYDELCQRYPATTGMVADAVVKLAGARARDIAGK